ncbi:Inositol phosphatase SIW14 [Ciborinia camelliae]|nr:Inositol phosphatase SIW14 [Ciborinia camelliae]
MSSALLHPPAHLSPALALENSQQAPSILRNTPSSLSSWSLSSIWSAAESPELWTTYENLVMSCLRTGDEKSAELCIKRLQERFGLDNERIMAMRGLICEIGAADDAELHTVLKGYETNLSDNPNNMPILKRRIAVLRSLGNMSEAITALNELLDLSPADAEAWAELSDLYVSQGMYPQGIFALEEVLLIAPNAWNIHARLGEILYIAAGVNDSSSDRYLAESMRRFCRSIELCDDYLRGYYGLKLASSQFLSKPPTNRNTKSDPSLPLPDRKTIEKLNETATSKLSEIVRRSAAKEPGWEGYDEASLIAARELLNRDSGSITH